jgi:hypothetical protein
MIENNVEFDIPASVIMYTDTFEHVVFPTPNE